MRKGKEIGVEIEKMSLYLRSKSRKACEFDPRTKCLPYTKVMAAMRRISERMEDLGYTSKDAHLRILNIIETEINEES